MGPYFAGIRIVYLKKNAVPLSYGGRSVSSLWPAQIKGG